MTDNNENNYDDEMTVELELDDGQIVNCAIITILTVDKKDYIALLPLDENGNNEDGEVWFYQYEEDENNPEAERHGLLTLRLKSGLLLTKTEHSKLTM